MAWPSRRRIGLAASAAVLASLVVVATLTDVGPFGSGNDHKSASPQRRDAASRPTGSREEPKSGSGRQTASPGVHSPGGGGDEGEPEWSVYVVGARGGGANLVARTPSEVPVTPAWSRRTGLIAYVRPGCEDCDAAVWVMRASGAARRKLPARLGNLTDPAWSPSARTLAAVKVGAGLYSISALRRASRPLLGRAVVEDPDWSPGGGAIAFARRQGAAAWDLYLIGPRGRGPRRLTRSRAQEQAPDWSPDGRRIAFQRQDPSGAWSIYVMRSDGSGVRRLVAGTTTHNVEQPAWSPDGHSIAFVAVTLSGTRIEVARLGTERHPLAVSAPGLQVADPDWSPDGGRIVFSGKRAKD